HPYIPGRLGITSRFAHDYASATVVRPQKFGFFNQALPSVSAGHVNERRNESPRKQNIAREGAEILPPSIVDEVPFDEEPRIIRPPSLNGSNVTPALSAEVIDQKLMANVLPTPADADINAAINELFAKMVWKKLDLIKDPLRLSRLHTEIMNVLQQAVAEEGTSIVYTEECEPLYPLSDANALTTRGLVRRCGFQAYWNH
uniref:Pecanex_C domain-containing protein n=1 Tax=Ascaris lumbricoides TaxID=6252 RepID=A0A0M3I6Y6_ASCLU